MTGYIVFAHGSPIDSANEAVRAVAAEMERRGGMLTVAAFLEGGKPDLSEAIDSLAPRVSRIVVVPYFLTLGLHLQRDLPRLSEEARRSHPEIVIHVTPPLDGHSALVEVLLARAREAEDA